MENVTDLILLVTSLFIAKLKTLVMAIWAFIEFFSGNFWVQFVLVTVLLYVVLRVSEKVYFWYMCHNYMHRKVQNSLTSFADFELFFKELTDRKRSNGIVPDLKYIKNRLHQYNDKELKLLSSFIHTLHRGYRDLRPSVWVAAFLFGIAAAYILDVIDFESLTWNFEVVLKTTTIIAFWYLISLYRYTNRKKKVAQLIGLIATSSKEKVHQSEDELQVKELNPSH
ncbi:hypothetical protein [Pseudalkalibacillus salsuginis]|uniref:hypothetical protein n=1 Tax=Pseudalkalibacillus salsuginis TaxID=2910972 RepID=UPI001F32984B|nr:hypothetical protein [Pseudalkalibacillus salsuginis]MCF6408890.1 hypothetical protein [Pseudalkalibacillus salsuginis]